MNVTKQIYKGRKLHKEDYLQKVVAEQQEYAREPVTVRIAENNDIIAGLPERNIPPRIRYITMTDYYEQVCEN